METMVVILAIGWALYGVGKLLILVIGSAMQAKPRKGAREWNL